MTTRITSSGHAHPSLRNSCNQHEVGQDFPVSAVEGLGIVS